MSSKFYATARTSLLAVVLLLAACTNTPDPADAPAETPAEAATPRIYFSTPANNATVPATFTVVMGAEGVEVAPAGDMREGTGHFHVLVDTDYIAAGEVIPNDARHLHFGTGATEAEITLEPGPHTLRLQLADGAHRAFENPAYRAQIQVVVE